jgi:hypothetical protein
MGAKQRAERERWARHDATGYGYVAPGTAVDFAWEPVARDGFGFRALVVAYAQD